MGKTIYFLDIIRQIDQAIFPKSPGGKQPPEKDSLAYRAALGLAKDLGRGLTSSGSGATPTEPSGPGFLENLVTGFVRDSVVPVGWRLNGEGQLEPIDSHAGESFAASVAARTKVAILPEMAGGAAASLVGLFRDANKPLVRIDMTAEQIMDEIERKQKIRERNFAVAKKVGGTAAKKTVEIGKKAGAKVGRVAQSGWHAASEFVRDKVAARQAKAREGAQVITVDSK